MTTTLEMPVASPVTEGQSPSRLSGWLVNPTFDALFLVNAAWPLLAVGLYLFGPDFHEGLRFWQVYFVTAAHRWITIPLVFLDRDRFQERPRLFMSIAIAAIVLCVGVRLSTGTLTCLLAIDYLWNAWHFASQHGGILRIYSRQAGRHAPQIGQFEKLLVRLFLLYVILRMSGLEWGLLTESAAALGITLIDGTPVTLESTLQLCDWGSLVLPLLLIAIPPLWSGGSVARGCYLASFLALYVAILAAVHVQRYDLVLLLATVSALFHATEYLAIVSWATHKRFPGQPAQDNILARLVPRWGLTVGCFALALAVVGWVSDQQTLQVWLLLNIIAAFLHYAYDGLIWKRPRPRVTA